MHHALEKAATEHTEDCGWGTPQHRLSWAQKVRRPVLGGLKVGVAAEAAAAAAAVGEMLSAVVGPVAEQLLRTGGGSAPVPLTHSVWCQQCHARRASMQLAAHACNIKALCRAWRDTASDA